MLEWESVFQVLLNTHEPATFVQHSSKTNHSFDIVVLCTYICLHCFVFVVNINGLNGLWSIFERELVTLTCVKNKLACIVTLAEQLFVGNCKHFLLYQVQQ